MIVKNSCEYPATGKICTSLPETFSCLRPSAKLKVLIVNSAHEQAIEAELSKQRRLLPGVAERINLPRCPWTSAFAKLLLDKSKADCLLIDNVRVVGGCFVIHTPLT